jgi:hypothetical protein
VHVNGSVQGSDDAFRGKRRIHFNGQRLSCAIIHDIKGSEPSSTDHAVTHEIHAPTLIHGCLLLQGLFYSGWQPSFSFPLLI